MLTWIVNKISRPGLKAAFVAIAFGVTGQFVVLASSFLLGGTRVEAHTIDEYVYTDRVSPSRLVEKTAGPASFRRSSL